MKTTMPSSSQSFLDKTSSFQIGFGRFQSTLAPPLLVVQSISWIWWLMNNMVVFTQQITLRREKLFLPSLSSTVKHLLGKVPPDTPYSILQDTFILSSTNLIVLPLFVKVQFLPWYHRLDTHFTMLLLPDYMTIKSS